VLRFQNIGHVLQFFGLALVCKGLLFALPVYEPSPALPAWQFFLADSGH
jgi:hypothetical protein